MNLRCLIFVFVLGMVFSQAALSQTTEFTYQGQLQASSSAASGNFDFEFLLFDSSVGGVQVGSTITRSGVAVANGIFAVNLDFGSSFPGAGRYLEVHVRSAGGGVFTTLLPRQAVSSSPYSIKSINADSATNAINAISATAATNFTGPLAGDVTGTQSSTTVARLQTRSVANTAPLDGQVLKFNAANNRWQPDTDNTGGGGGTITGVTAGTGLTGGGVSGSVTVGIASGGVGTGQLADGSVTDAKIVGVSGAKVTGPVSNATAAVNFSGTLAGDVTGTQGATSIASNAVTTAKIADANVTNSKLANGSVTDTKIVDVAGSKITGAIPVGAVPAGSGNYIQNQNAGPQSSSNFNVSGTGTANIFSGATQYNIGNLRVLRAVGSSVFAGFGAGSSNTTGNFNSFFGDSAGVFNTTGSGNSFFGNGAGASTMISNDNSFFGGISGRDNTTGTANSFFGFAAGLDNVTGNFNTIIGSNADVATSALTNATAIGAAALVGQSNSLVLGSINGVNSATADTRVAVGTTSPTYRLHVKTGNQDGIKIQNGGGDFQQLRWTNAADATTALISVGPVGSEDMRFFVNGADRMIVEDTGTVIINTLGAAGSTTLCRNTANQISTCSSSLRYKTNIGQFSQGMSFVNKLRPISFDWKDGGLKDVGFGAEEIAKIDPRFVTFNDRGEVEGVKYDRLSAAFVNAFKEQQSQIDTQEKRNQAQQKQIELQRSEIDALKALVCRKNRRAAVCKAKQ